MSANDNEFMVHENSIDGYDNYSRYVSNPRFEIVTFEQFKNDMIATFDEYDDSNESIDEIKTIYNSIEFPTRSTKCSAGYDFKSPFYFYLDSGDTIMIPTGIRAYMPYGMVLMVYPRSGLGTKYRLGLCNTVAVIDSDYYFANNEGHIHLKLVNNGDERVAIDAGKAFAQGVFTSYYTVYNDAANGVRRGGFGSTDN